MRKTLRNARAAIAVCRSAGRFMRASMTESEWIIMRTHPEIGHRILSHAALIQSRNEKPVNNGVDIYDP